MKSAFDNNQTDNPKQFMSLVAGLYWFWRTSQLKLVIELKGGGFNESVRILPDRITANTATDSSLTQIIAHLNCLQL